MSLENLFDLLGGSFQMPAHFGWGVGSVVAVASGVWQAALTKK